MVLGLAGLAASAQGLKPAAALCAPFYGELASKGRATRAGGEPGLLPLGAAADRIRAGVAADKPSILVESLFFLPRAASADEAGRRAELAGIYGLLRSFSSLEGIQYYSVTHKSMRVLYAESYRIDGPDSKLRLPDIPPPPPSDIPAEETLYAYQRDLTFGANRYSFAFASSSGAVSAEMTNLTRLSYGIVPLVAPKALKTRLLVVQALDGILFYVESDSTTAGPFRSRLEESFGNRANALFSWFEAKSAPFVRR